MRFSFALWNGVEETQISNSSICSQPMQIALNRVNVLCVCVCRMCFGVVAYTEWIDQTFSLNLMCHLYLNSHNSNMACIPIEWSNEEFMWYLTGRRKDVQHLTSLTQTIWINERLTALSSFWIELEFIKCVRTLFYTCNAYFLLQITLDTFQCRWQYAHIDWNKIYSAVI